jgi:DNA-binding CsgD family transcriptional regulator
VHELNEAELLAVFGGARVADTSILPPPNPLVSQTMKLTPRQAQCLDWVAVGKTSVEIGILLNLSPLSVDTYIRAACQSLGVRTRVEAVAAKVRTANNYGASTPLNAPDPGTTETKSCLSISQISDIEATTPNAQGALRAKVKRRLRKHG